MGEQVENHKHKTGSEKNFVDLFWEQKNLAFLFLGMQNFVGLLFEHLDKKQYESKNFIRAISFGPP